jgi:hypothetical protein
MNYRPTALLVVLLCVALTPAPAQKITGGFKGGMNLARMHGDEVLDAEIKFGFCGGGFASFALGQFLVIQPELLYSQKGARWEEEILDETWTMTYKLNYVELPLLLKMTMPVQGKVKPNLFLGPYFGIMITDPRFELEFDGTTGETDLEGVKDTDAGVVFGGGIDFGLPRGKIVFDIRYSLGLITVDDEGGADVKNNVFSFLLGYSF